MLQTFETVWFGSGSVQTGRGVDFREGFRINVQYNSEPKFEAVYLPPDWHKTATVKNRSAIEITIRDPEFVPLLKLFWHADWNIEMTEPLKAFLTELGFKLPSRFRVRDGMG